MRSVLLIIEALMILPAEKNSARLFAAEGDVSVIEKKGIRYIEREEEKGLLGLYLPEGKTCWAALSRNGPRRLWRAFSSEGSDYCLV